MEMSQRKLLILDLDETLIHARFDPLDRRHDFKATLYYAYKRPHLDRFLVYALEHFDVAVWTSAGERYAADVIKAIFPDPTVLQFAWSAARCSQRYDAETQTYYHGTKPLTKVRRQYSSRWPVAQILAVDDSPYKWAESYGNYIPISEWTGDEEDSELLALIEYLETLRELPDLRRIEKRSWRSQIKNTPAF